MQYWKDIKKATINKDVENSLNELIKHTINQSGDKKINNLLNEIKGFKDLADDINHCTYRIVQDESKIKDFCEKIDSLMSKIYGR